MSFVYILCCYNSSIHTQSMLIPSLDNYIGLEELYRNCELYFQLREPSSEKKLVVPRFIFFFSNFLARENTSFFSIEYTHSHIVNAASDASAGGCPKFPTDIIVSLFR